jgi:hypothetical protein
MKGDGPPGDGASDAPGSAATTDDARGAKTREAARGVFELFLPLPSKPTIINVSPARPRRRDLGPGRHWVALPASRWRSPARCASSGSTPPP